MKSYLTKPVFLQSANPIKEPEKEPFFQEDKETISQNSKLEAPKPMIQNSFLTEKNEQAPMQLTSTETIPSTNVKTNNITTRAAKDITLTAKQKAQLIATVMAESDQGNYAQRDIAWIYINLIGIEGFETGMSKSTAYNYENDWYKAYMIQLGEGSDYKNDKVSTATKRWMKVDDNGTERTASNVGEYVEKSEYFKTVAVPKLNKMKTFIEQEVLLKQASNPYPGWTGQGYYRDLNNNPDKGDHWNQVRQYYVLYKEGELSGKWIKV